MRSGSPAPSAPRTFTASQGSPAADIGSVVVITSFHSLSRRVPAEETLATQAKYKVGTLDLARTSIIWVRCHLNKYILKLGTDEQALDLNKGGDSVLPVMRRASIWWAQGAGAAGVCAGVPGGAQAGGRPGLQHPGRPLPEAEGRHEALRLPLPPVPRRGTARECVQP